MVFPSENIQSFVDTDFVIFFLSSLLGAYGLFERVKELINSLIPS